MNFNLDYILRSLASFVLLLLITSCSQDENQEFSEVVKVSLRDVGHQLLLADKDSISLVKPVVVLGDLKYQVSFESELTIDPDSLIAIVKSSLLKSGLPQDYLTEVIQCSDEEVGYSYEMKGPEQKGIIPCRGRILPKACYKITVRFSKIPKPSAMSKNYIYLPAVSIIAIFAFVYYKRRSVAITKKEDDNYKSIGRFRFYPEENKLIKEATEIGLSKIECELLAIFVAEPNKVIKRDELSKRVWEDKGVVVGRSLDTYISKLRKKLQDDDSIKLTNIHGVGYKLEIE